MVELGGYAHREPPSLRITPFTGEKDQAGRTFCKIPIASPHGEASRIKPISSSGVGFIGFSSVVLLMIGNCFFDAARLICMAEAAVVHRRFGPYSPGVQSFIVLVIISPRWLRELIGHLVCRLIFLFFSIFPIFWGDAKLSIRLTQDQIGLRLQVNFGAIQPALLDQTHPSH